MVAAVQVTEVDDKTRKKKKKPRFLCITGAPPRHALKTLRALKALWALRALRALKSS